MAWKKSGWASSARAFGARRTRSFTTSARALAQEYGVHEVYADYREMAERCAYDAVAIDASSHNLIQIVTDEHATTPDILVQNTVFGRCKGLSYESILAILRSAESGIPVDVEL